MSILKAIAARLFTRRKSNLIVVHEKRWPTSHLFFAVEIFENLTGSFAVNTAQDGECAGSASSN